MEGMQKLLLSILLASGNLAAQFGECTPYLLGQGVQLNTASLVIHAVVSRDLGQLP